MDSDWQAVALFVQYIVCTKYVSWCIGSYNLHQKQKCEEDHGHCTQFLESFTRDHLRLPVTALTSDILHSHNE